MTDLSDYVESLKRSVATPGTFTTEFPDTTDDDLVGSLSDAFCSAQLDGFFPGATYQLDIDNAAVTPSLTGGERALVILYGARSIVEAELFNRQNRQKYEAKGVSVETEQGSNILTSLLKTINARISTVITQAQTFGAGAAFEMADQYFIRAVGTYPGVSYGPDLDRAYDYHSIGW